MKILIAGGAGFIMEFVRRYNLDTRIAWVFNPYGPRSHRSDGRVVPNFCIQALQGDAITIYGDGSQSGSICYVERIWPANLLLRMETDDLSGEVVNP